jgi:hypothetical protein
VPGKPAAILGSGADLDIQRIGRVESLVIEGEEEGFRKPSGYPEETFEATGENSAERGVPGARRGLFCNAR